MIAKAKKIYFVIIIESLLVFLFWFLRGFIDETRFIYWIFPGFIAASLVGNIFLSWKRREMLSSFALLQSFFVSIIFFQTLVSEHLAKGVAIGSALVFFVVVLGFSSVIGRDTEALFHATKPSMIHVLSLLTLFFIVYDIYALRIIFPLPTTLIFLILFLSVTLMHYAATNLLLGSPHNFYCPARISRALGAGMKGFHKESSAGPIPLAKNPPGYPAALPQGRVYSTFVLGVLMIVEFFSLLYFAPIPVYAKAVMVTTAYYTFLGIVEVQNLPVIDTKRFKTYIGIGLMSFALILLTARWR